MPDMASWLQGIALVLLAVILEALIDEWVDRRKAKRGQQRHTH